MLIVDSREKWTQGSSRDAHIREYLERHAVPYVVQKLDVGDYALTDGKIAVDRKQNLDEVAKNLLNRADSARFWREIRRAHDQAIKLVVLVEHGPTIKSIRDVGKWRSPWSGVSGRLVADAMCRAEFAYGVRWCFCSKKSTARRILEILEERE